MIAALDTDVLLDVLIGDESHYASSKERLDRAHSQGGLIICEVVYAELVSQFGDVNSLEGFLERTGIRLVPSNLEAIRRAGLLWQQYVRRRQEGLQCPECGVVNRPMCTHCGSQLRGRQHIITDFMIGAHALVQADFLITKDRGFYRGYFPNLKVV